MDILDLALVAGALFVGYQLLQSSSSTTTTAAPVVSTPGQVPIGTPAPPVPTAAPIANAVPGLGTAPVSSPYQVTPAATSLASPVAVSTTRIMRGGVLYNYTRYNNGTTSTTPVVRTSPNTPTPAAPSNVVGGISGNVGTGGVPLGGQVVPGVSYGTGTTVIPLVY